MYIQLVREHFTKKATEGKLFVNGVFECYTLEDTDRHLENSSTKVYGETAIPRGKYAVIVTYSNRFKKRLPLLVDVKDFTGIRIHVGNKPEDTEGCILVGYENKAFDDNWIGVSIKAFEQLLIKIDAALINGEDVIIEIV